MSKRRKGTSGRGTNRDRQDDVRHTLRPVVILRVGNDDIPQTLPSGSKDMGA